MTMVSFFSAAQQLPLVNAWKQFGLSENVVPLYPLLTHHYIFT